MSQEKPMSCIFSLGVWHLLHLKSRVHRAAVVSRDRKAQILRFCKHRTLWKSKVKDGRHAANDTCRTSNNMFKKHDYKFIVIQYGETWRKRVNLYITPQKLSSVCFSEWYFLICVSIRYPFLCLIPSKLNSPPERSLILKLCGLHSIYRKWHKKSPFISSQ